jgi:hypothetical protein
MPFATHVFCDCDKNVINECMFLGIKDAPIYTGEKNLGVF